MLWRRSCGFVPRGACARGLFSSLRQSSTPASFAKVPKATCGCWLPSRSLANKGVRCSSSLTVRSSTQEAGTLSSFSTELRGDGAGWTPRTGYLARGRHTRTASFLGLSVSRRRTSWPRVKGSVFRV
ncbi:unnamed protein product [Symbiodinium sp. CCMP2592]|nr:unnamed protein product [Symbiodinium sp. CCMP2592]